MIEYRGSLRKDKRFEGGFNLKAGTVIYVRETDHGWIGMYYEEKGSGHGFALEGDDFSIWRNPDGQNEIILMKEEPEDQAELARVREIEIKQAHRKAAATADRAREAQAELDRLLA